MKISLGASLAALTPILPWLLAGGAAGARPDIELGRYLASECMTCHRSASVTGTIPNIFGMAETRFVQRIRAYKEKRLENQIMQTIAGRLSDDDIEALAAYFAVTKKP